MDGFARVWFDYQRLHPLVRGTTASSQSGDAVGSVASTGQRGGVTAGVINGPVTGPITTGPCPVIQIGGTGNQGTGGNCGPASRHLSPGQHKQMKALLLPVKAKAIIWYFGSDSDTRQFAQDMWDAFHDAGWDMDSPKPQLSFQDELFPFDISAFAPRKPGMSDNTFGPAAAEALGVINLLKTKLTVGAGYSERSL
jgi:hypothetical protein